MRKLTLLAIIAGLLATAACVSAEPIQLAYKFKAGDKSTYALTMTLSIRMAGLPGAPEEPMKISMSSKITQKVLSVLPDSSAKIKYFFTPFKMSGFGSSRSVSAMKPMSMVVTMTPDGKAVSVEGLQGMPAVTGMNADQFVSQFGLVSALPPGPVSVGDTWVSKMPVAFGDPMDLHSMLDTDNAMVGKTRAAKIVQSYAGSIDLAKMMQAMMGGLGGSIQNPQARQALQSVTGTMEIRGDSNFYMSVDTGKMLRAEGFSSMTSTMQAPPQLAAQGGPSSLKMSMGMQVTLNKL